MKKLKTVLLNHKKKLFYASIIVLIITNINFIDEVVLGGQGLFSSPEELVGWILGWLFGSLGLLFLKENNYFKTTPKP